MEFYTLVYQQTILRKAEILYNLHSSLTERCVDESFRCIKNAQESEFLNIFIKQINKNNYILYFLYRAFNYMDRYIEDKNLASISTQSFRILKDDFLIPYQDKLSKALTNYFLNNNNLENEENSSKIKKILNLMNADKFSKQKIIKKNNEIIWENEGNNLKKNGKNMFDKWFNNYVLKDIRSYYKKKSIEFKDLPITELISSILNVNYQTNFLKNYFDGDYYNKISLAFNENFIKNNKEKIENYFFNLDKNGFKQFYEINENSKSCLNLICTFLIYSKENNGLKIFENKGVQFNLKEENICIPIEIKKALEKFFSEFFNKNDPEYNNSLFKICQKVLNIKSYSKNLALYVNDCMRRNFKGKAEEEKNNELNQIIQSIFFIK